MSSSLAWKQHTSGLNRNYLMGRHRRPLSSLGRIAFHLSLIRVFSLKGRNVAGHPVDPWVGRSIAPAASLSTAGRDL
jgi:hypothetical protein